MAAPAVQAHRGLVLCLQGGKRARSTRSFPKCKAPAAELPAAMAKCKVPR